jgi:tetratricopeptide (TPR) repeat protein
MKKIPIIPIIGLLVPVLLAAQSAFADVAADVSQAEALYKAGQYTQAEQVYLAAIEEADPNKPADVEAVFNARKKLASVYIATDRLLQAKEAVQRLLSQHAGHESLPTAIHEIVEAAKPVYRLAQVRQLCQEMVTAKPDDPQTLWLKMGVAIASVCLTDDQATDAALQNITSQHAADGRAAEVLNQIAWACRKLQRYNNALTIYEYVMDNWPEKDRAAFAQHGIVICHLGFRNPQAADAALEVLLQKYGTDRNTSKLLLWTGNAYCDAGEFEGGYRVFDLVVQNYPDTPEAAAAEIALAITAAQKENRARFEPAIQTLLTRFPPDEVKALGLHNVATTIVWKYMAYASHPPQELNLLESYDKCLVAIANYTMATWPNSDWAMWAQRDLATVAIRSGDAAAAQAATTQLSTAYANRQETLTALNFVANYLLEVRNNGAEAVYEYLAEKYPGHELMPIVQAGLALVEIHQNNDAEADTILQKVLTQYADSPKLAEAVRIVGEGYYLRAMAPVAQARKEAGPDPNRPRLTAVLPESALQDYRKAIEVLEIVTQKLPANPVETPVAYRVAGDSYRRIGQLDKSAECYQYVCDHWPTCEYAGHLQFMLAKLSKEMAKSGQITQADADSRIGTALATVVQKYPDCPAGKAANDWLAVNARVREGEQR